MDQLPGQTLTTSEKTRNLFPLPSGLKSTMETLVATRKARNAAGSSTPFVIRMDREHASRWLRHLKDLCMHTSEGWCTTRLKPNSNFDVMVQRYWRLQGPDPDAEELPSLDELKGMDAETNFPEWMGTPSRQGKSTTVDAPESKESPQAS